MSASGTSDPPTDLVKNIEADIRKSGFPLEIYALNVCSTKNTGRMPSVRYEYADELREIDLLAFFETMHLKPRGNTPPQHSSTDMIIECKKSADKPWVFFSSPSYTFENVAVFLKYISDFDQYFSKRRLPLLLAQIYPRILNGHYSDPAIPRCISYYEAFRGTSAPSEIYRAIDSVITYLCYRQKSRASGREEFGVFSEFYLPIIVLDGYLFEASIDGAEINVCGRSHLQLRTFHRNEVYIIDVVTRDQFQQFFDRVGFFHEELVSAIASLKFPSAFRATAKARLDNMEKSSKADPTLSIFFAEAKRQAKARRMPTSTRGNASKPPPSSSSPG